jgi:2-methylcitrate dehydratase
MMARDQGVETRSSVEHIAAFAAAARTEPLTAEIRHLLKRNILDSLGCAIAALSGPPFRALRQQLERLSLPTTIHRAASTAARTTPSTTKERSAL